VLYRLVLFPVTLSDPNYRKSLHFDILYCHIFAVNGDRDFKFCTWVGGRKCASARMANQQRDGNKTVVLPVVLHAVIGQIPIFLYMTSKHMFTDGAL